ncbi:MAG: MopE-related protein [Deltaproteobacteria bacterium]|nr:MopE-related protein [Deltaproteobacteria bacterium]
MGRNLVVAGVVCLSFIVWGSGGCSCDGGGGLGNCPDEICNGVDDDCDGLTDEGPEGGPDWSQKGETCFVGLGACSAAGVFICDETNRTGPLVCSGAPGTGETEICNGVDDDCDGQTDEEPQWSNLNEVCRVVEGGCEGVGIFICDPLDPNAATICDAVAGPPTTEICDGRDNDCDGNTDEGTDWTDIGAVCTNGIGTCQRPGLKVCDPSDSTGPTICNAVPAAESIEICNGVDDDCDGQTDEEALWADKGAVCTSGLGICETPGIRLCDPANPAGPTVCSASQSTTGTFETCNGLDDDCDGQTDEDATWADKGSLCSRGLGACQRTGVLSCDPTNPAGPTICNAIEGTPSAEVCDRVDNDCDGNTDEDALWLDLGNICRVGIGACENVGVKVCDTANPAGATACSVGASGGGAEVCNGLDDDCDGSTDEDPAWTDKGQVCTVSTGQCAATGTLGCDTANPGGPLLCSATAGATGTEVCNALDDDCDGQTDEDATWADKGTVCTVGQGICQASGTLRCDTANPAGPTVCSATPGAAGVEVCNGLDDDCDGLTDEDALWTDKGAICTSGVGQCTTTGTRGCDPANPAGPTICSATPGAAGTEICNGLDDDCDGSTDEDAQWATKGQSCQAGTGQCATGGLFVCDAANPSGPAVCSATPSTPGTEVCNGLDDDCDGQTDENAIWLDKGDVCTDGVGTCEVVGVLVCDTANPSGATVCSAVAGSGGAEICNGLDDDCDGQTDEILWADKGSSCTVGTGQCAASGVRVCDTGTPGGPTVCSVTMGTPGVEVCDGLDNDCDSLTDEDAQWSDKGTVCTNGAGTCETSGTKICDTANPGGPTVCSAIIGTPGVEVCNGLDDDCDGSTDEGATWADKGVGCTAGNGQCAASGVRVCDTGDPTGPTVCSATPGAPGSEVCDGLDNDCDGQTDEILWANKGTICTEGTGTCQQTGVRVCDTGNPGGPTVCSVTAGAPGSEVCDGLDNDCDSSTDEIVWADKGTVCVVGSGTCEAYGVRTCDTGNPAGPTVCSATPGAPGAEVCNNLDDDCDGQTDEITWADKGTLCTDGNGQCSVTGQRICDTANPAGPTVCSATALPPGIETCNNLDDDCDGQTDEIAWADKGTLCTAGAGQCSVTGQRICDGGNPSGPTVCSASPLAPGTEVCNGLDDDCDGSTDEIAWADKGTVCTSGQGQCAATGTRVCDTGNPAGPTVCSATAGAPGSEVCNNLDDDCDGSTDEIVWADKGTLCTDGIGACEVTGFKVCDSGNPGGPTVCSVTAGGGSAEVCNGLDDDCDGSTDEISWPDKGTGCVSGSGVCAQPGIKVCDTGNPAGPTVCSATPGAPTAEVCDDLDNDCDGSTDEISWANKGTSCSTGQGICEAAGILICNTANPAGPTVCSANAGLPGTELCNGLDDDCDGSVDDGLAAPDCVEQDGVCKGSVQSCGGSLGWRACTGPEYGTDYQPTELSCDGLDNDCDGLEDNGLPSQPCANQTGVCGGAMAACSGGAWTVCGAAQYGPEYEGNETTCDQLDNDCDGTTDEGYLNGATGKYDQNTACGNCYTNCTTIFAYPNAYGTCDASGAPVCQMNCCGVADTNPACDGLFDYFDLNGVPDDGCEFQNDPSALHVSTPGNGGADSPSCGTSGNPCATIGYGISQAFSGGQLRVRVSGGAYYENFDLVAGIDVLGGYNPTTWSRNVAANTTVIYGVGGPVATPDDRAVVRAFDITSPTEFSGFVIFGEISTGVGGNSYGIYVEDSDNSLTIRDNLIYAGDGGPGDDGLDGATGTSGLDGNPGVAARDEATCPTNLAGSNMQIDLGGAGGALSCLGTNVTGGQGGASYCPDFDESGAQPASNPTDQYPVAAMDGTDGLGPNPGAGGITGWDAFMYKSGTPPSCTCYQPPDPNEPTGAPAANGGNGFGGNGGSGCTSTDGTVSGIRWQGLSGGPGFGGQPGSGGGGGGAGGGVENYNCNTDGDSDVGGSGGGGGSGGCGGGGGAGGDTGGGSFGIYLAFNSVPASVPVITGNTINTGLGGSGGRGGNGGFGGIGGTGGLGGLEGQAGSTAWCAGGGGRGGEGGNGGSGGGGGGGCGGVSYGIFATGQGGVNLNAIRTGNNYSLAGGGGSGGEGGLSLSVAGSDGLTGTEADTNF